MSLSSLAHRSWHQAILTGTVLLGLQWMTSCRCSDETPESPAKASTQAPSPEQPRSPPIALGTRPARERLDLISQLAACNIVHFGLTVDLGAPHVRIRQGFRLSSAVPGRVIDRAGASFLEITERRFSMDVWLDEGIDEPEVTTRVVGHQASSVTLRIDRRFVSRRRVEHDQITEVHFARAEGRLEPGRHTLSFEFWGRRAQREQDPAFIEMDWIHLGQSDQPNAQFSAPTLRDVVADQEIDSVPKRSLVLRAPSAVRCPLLLGQDAHLRVSLGFWGASKGVAEVRILRDMDSPVTLREHTVVGGHGAQWTPLDVDLSEYAHEIVYLELRARRASKGGRVVFGEPEISRAHSEPPVPPHARTAVVVMAAGLDRRQIPPWGPIGELTALGELYRNGVAFDQYRAPTSVPAGVMASLLTGLPPRIHGVEDTGARLGESAHLIEGLVKQASGRTAMFTNVPTSFGAFGFDSSWDEFEVRSPVHDIPASAPILDAARWLSREFEQGDDVPRLVLIHVRGMHPPWDLTKAEVARLQPTEYDGILDPRRAGIVLGRLRHSSLRTQRRLAQEDWKRLRVLSYAAFVKQSEAMGQLIDTLKKHDAWRDCLFVFVGDVAAGDPPHIPFDPMGQLRPDELLGPLLVKFPQDEPHQISVPLPATTVDITRTLLDALNLQVPEMSNGADLYALARGYEPVFGRTLVATLGGRYCTRGGVWLLCGELGETPSLCQTDVDPSCTEDLLLVRPLTAGALWQWTAEALERMQEQAPKSPREPASVDKDTAAALTVWGDVVQ